MNTKPIILVVGATSKENSHIEKYLMDWKYEVISLKEAKSGIVASIPKSPGIVLVYAQEEQKNAIAICEQIRKDHEGTTAPILLVIGRYKMSQYYELRRRMENITSIITPFKQEEIRTRIDEILGTT